VHANLCLHIITTPSLWWEGGTRVGDYLKYSPLAAKIILSWRESGGKILKNDIVDIYRAYYQESTIAPNVSSPFNT